MTMKRNETLGVERCCRLLRIHDRARVPPAAALADPSCLFEIYVEEGSARTPEWIDCREPDKGPGR
jgi:hypothetical protein